MIYTLTKTLSLWFFFSFIHISKAFVYKKQCINLSGHWDCLYWVDNISTSPNEGGVGTYVVPAIHSSGDSRYAMFVFFSINWMNTYFIIKQIIQWTNYGLSIFVFNTHWLFYVSYVIFTGQSWWIYNTRQNLFENRTHLTFQIIFMHEEVSEIFLPPACFSAWEN